MIILRQVQYQQLIVWYDVHTIKYHQDQLDN